MAKFSIQVQAQFDVEADTFEDACDEAVSQAMEMEDSEWGTTEIHSPMPQDGQLWVGANEQGEIVVNHPALKPDRNGIGHLIFSPEQARNLARILNKHADAIQ